MRLIQFDCQDACSPHPHCLDCNSLCCRHTIEFLTHVQDVHAAIAALPMTAPDPPAPTWPALELLTTLPCEQRTACFEWRGAHWRRPMPVLVVELGVVGLPPAWRDFLGLN